MSTTSLARELATEQAGGVVPEIVKSIRRAKQTDLAILGTAIACTYYHQAHWLASIDGFGIGSIQGVALSLGWVAPLVWDASMVGNAHTLQTRALTKAAKVTALVLMVAGGAVSATINILAPGAMLARIIFALLVALAVGHKVKSALLKPDLAELDRIERAAKAEVPVAPPAGRGCPNGCACGKHSPKRKAPAKRTRKAAPAKAPAAAPKAPTLASAMARLPEAPVSPAPGDEYLTTTGLWVAVA